MVDVTDHWWWAIAIAAASGALGGLVYDLMLTRQGDAGLLELFSTQESKGGRRKYVDTGFVASVLVGAAAAIGFLYFLTPEASTMITKAGKVVTTREYDPFKLVPAAIIVGTGGSAFLTSMQQRLLKLVAQTNLDALAHAVTSQGQEAAQLLAQASDPDHPQTEPGALQVIKGKFDGLNAVAQSMLRASD